MPPSFLNSERTLNIAHRGASRVAPENTLAAFERAAELGADGIELDVRMSADGVPVVIHNATVDATTDGSGRVGELTLAQLKRLDAGAWFDAHFAGQRIPSLEETLEAVGESLLLNIELKGEEVLGGGLARAVVDLIMQYGLGDRVILSSFNPLALRRVQRAMGRIPTALLYMSARLPRVGEWVTPNRYAALHPHRSVLSEDHLRWIRQRDYRVHVWTVDEPDEMRRLVEWGVDGIITNVPDVLHGALGRAS